ncbi:MAG: hypothetical protein K6T51_00880 [Rubrobacteraceae bacterium]|uniref:hypothetical protein n=1 Tax=Rubrobacter naiadicus TaxID=1392641 RepID=UPI0023600DE5|nr:hypothetical protein [Rubrobacter naiadicus]MBX6763330.1 hypothetical protein [Rubrobacteraceae bacterium]MCL6437135.1 hypothetical protein [Rubrobacteraceae bacterium]
MQKEMEGTPGFIVRHTSRRLGSLDRREACERLISGRISFSEFVDQGGEGFRELLEFMIDYDLHPGRPEEVLFCIDCYAKPGERAVLREQLRDLYRIVPGAGSAGFQGA